LERMTPEIRSSAHSWRMVHSRRRTHVVYRRTYSMTRHVLPTSLPPRGLSRVEASQYIGVSPSLFDEMVGDGRMPPPKQINARRVWDRKQLDQSFEALPDVRGGGTNPWDS